MDVEKYTKIFKSMFRPVGDWDGSSIPGDMYWCDFPACQTELGKVDGETLILAYQILNEVNDE